MATCGTNRDSWMVAGGFPIGDRKEKLDRSRHRMGRIWEVLLRVSTVSGLIVLSLLLYNVLNSSLGFILLRNTVSSDLLVLGQSPHVQVGETVRQAVGSVQSDPDLIAILHLEQDEAVPVEVQALELPLKGFEGTYQLWAITSWESQVLVHMTSSDIESGLLVEGQNARNRNGAPDAKTKFLLVPDSIGVMGAWLSGLELPELSKLSKEQLTAILGGYVSDGLMRRLERDEPFASRSVTDIMELIQLRVVNPQIVRSFSLRDSLLRRDYIEAVATKELASLEFKNWLSANFITNAQSSRPLLTGIRTALLGSLWVIAITILFSVPLGIGAAIYLEEYSSHNWFGRLIETNINNLAGVPSIIYGMLGLVIFVRALDLLTSGALFGLVSAQESNGRTIISAGLTLGLLILPVIIINGQEAIRAVPNSLREASYGVGATKLMTIRHHILPSAASGIFTGAILAVSRAVGETAPLVVIGAATFISTDPNSIFAKFTVLPIQIYQWTSRPQQEFQHIAAAAIVVLLALLLTVNATAVLLRQRYGQQRI